MKKLYVLSITIFICTQLNAQFGYDLSVLQQGYQHIAGGTIVNNGTATDDSLISVPVGFNFTLAGNTGAMLNFHFNERGFYFDNEAPTASRVSGFFVMEPDVYNHGDTAGDVILTPLIAYKTTGQAGSRVFMAEILNMTFFRENYLYGTWDDTFSVTIRLKELDQSIEIHWGPSNINHASDYFVTQNGPYVGLMLDYDAITDTVGTIYYLGGNVAGPAIETASNFDTLLPALNSMPATNTVFRFVPANTGVHNVDATTKVNLVNTLCASTLLVNNSNKRNVSYQVISLIGSTVHIKGTLNHGQNIIDVGTLSPGIYLFQCRDQDGYHVSRFVKM